MSTTTLIEGIRARHAPHSSSQEPCDACRALEMLDRARIQLQRLQEMVAKGQWDPVAAMAAIKEGLR